MRSFLSAFSALILSAVLAFSLYSCDSGDSTVSPLNQENPGSIQGRVTYEGGSSFGGVTITLEEFSAGMTARTAAAKTAVDQGQTLSDTSSFDGSIFMTTVTESDGSYSFSDVPPGEYSITAQRTADHLAKVANVAVTAGAATVVDIVLVATGSIAGTVHLDGVTDNSGILVYIPGTSYMAITDSNGSYVIKDVPLGSYEIMTNAHEYDIAKLSVTLDKAGAAVTVPVINPGKTGSIVGNVVNGFAGTPVAEVTVSTLNGDISTVTGENGVFTITGVPAGSSRLSFVKDGYDTAWIDVPSIKSGEQTTLPAAVKLYMEGTTPPTDEDRFNEGYTSALLELEGSNTGPIEGDSTRERMEGLIPVYDVKHSIEVPIDAVTGRVSGTTRYSPLTIVKHVDKSSPLLMKMCSTGEVSTKFILTFFRHGSDGRDEHFYTIELEDALITNIATRNFEENKQYQLVEEITFTYTKIIWINEIHGTEYQASYYERI